MEDAFMLLLGALAFPILGIILLLMPWRKIKRRMSYPLGPDGIDKEAKAHASHTISLSYMEQTSSPRLDNERSGKGK
jgi:hypothetical protein